MVKNDLYKFIIETIPMEDFTDFIKWESSFDFTVTASDEFFFSATLNDKVYITAEAFYNNLEVKIENVTDDTDNNALTYDVFSEIRNKFFA